MNDGIFVLHNDLCIVSSIGELDDVLLKYTKD